MGKNTIIFDMDGVISDTQEANSELESLFLRKHGIVLTAHELTRDYAGISERECAELIFKKYGKEVDLDKFVKDKLAALAQFTKGKVRPIKGAINLINKLSENNFKLAVASSSRMEFIEMVLSELGVKDKFDILASGQEVKFGKPNPDIFLLAARRLNARPSECVVIEDSKNGVMAAKKAGMKCIWLTNREFPEENNPPADITVRSLEELQIEDFKNPDLSIVLPAYNESENLPDLIKGLKKVLNKENVQSEIIVVDNGSGDNTKEVLASLEKEIGELRTLRIKKNIGYGNGIIKGLEAAQGSVLGYMVADGQIPPEALAKVYRKLNEGNLDFCKGFRISRCDGLVRLVMSKVYNFLFRIMFDCPPIKDIGGGPKIFTRHFYDAVKLQSQDFFIEAEILIKAGRNNFSVGEIPVVSLERKKGRSSVSILDSFESLRDLFYLFLFKKF